MLIEDYDLEVYTPPCDPGAERYAARARLMDDISAALPYLNATLKGAIYTPAAQALTWKKAGHSIAFHAYEIDASNIEDRQMAEDELRGLIALVNRTWERRLEIQPSNETRQRPTQMAVYKLLPKTNCKACGDPTCWIFAAQLVTGHKPLAECTPLLDAQYAQNLAELLEMF